MGVSFDFKRGLKSLWAETAQGITPSLEASRAIAFSNLAQNSDPLSEVLSHLALKNTGQIPVPLVPRFSHMPVAELCQLALFWATAGEKEAASMLSHSIPLDFPWLWSRENEYQERATIASVQLLAKALGRSVENIPGGDPYFQALANHIPTLGSPQIDASVLDWSLIETESITCCFTFSGDRTSLGAMVSDAVEIRAFGPQVVPLSDPLGFGIRSISKHGHRWASPSGSSEVWFEFNARKEEARIVFDLTFIGLKPSAPLAFSFYVKAESAHIGNEKIKPKTLHRYHGISKPILFGNGLILESLSPGKMELIPLAGSEGYWNCEYLAAYEVHPVNAKMSFAFYTPPRPKV